MSKIIAVSSVIIVILIGGIVWWQSSSNTPQVEQQNTLQTSTKEFTWRLVGRKLVEGSPTLTVNQGDTVVLTIISDEADSAHLHGYDVSEAFEPGVPATLTFVANASGRFEIELHEGGNEIGAIEVLP